jgi:MOSC domain-containing protein YiiM
MVAGMNTTSDGGVVQAIYVSPGRKIPMKSVHSVQAESGKGLVGDRYHGTKHRHVSVQSFEDLTEAAAVFEAPIDHDLTRRNITVTGFEIPTKPGERIRINGVLLEVVRIAAPCKLLDDDIGAGAKTALRRRAGTIFRLLGSGTISVGDSVEHTANDQHDQGVLS